MLDGEVVNLDPERAFTGFSSEYILAIKENSTDNYIRIAMFNPSTGTLTDLHFITEAAQARDLTAPGVLKQSQN